MSAVPDTVLRKDAQNLENVKTPAALDERELLRAIRDAVIAEEGAIKQYETVADATQDAKVRETLQSIADEEKVHIGELQELLKQRSPDEQRLQDEGAAEVEKHNPKKAEATVRLSTLTELLKTAAKQTTGDKKKCPGGKLRSAGKGRGLGFGKGRGPVGVPFGAKKSEDQLVQALQQVKLAQAFKEAQLTPEQAEILKQVLPDLVTPGGMQVGTMAGGLLGGLAGAGAGALEGRYGHAGPLSKLLLGRKNLTRMGAAEGALSGTVLGAGAGALGGMAYSRHKARKAVSKGEKKPEKKEKEKEDVSEKESQAFMIGFLTKCAEAGFTAQELEKVAVNWASVLQALKGFGGGAQTGAGNVVDVIRSLIQGGAASTPHLTGGAARAGQLTGQIGLPTAALGAAGLGGAALGRAAAPEPPDTLGEKLRALLNR
jgi:rubrerythrin